VGKTIVLLQVGGCAKVAFAWKTRVSQLLELDTQPTFHWLLRVLSLDMLTATKVIIFKIKKINIEK